METKFATLVLLTLLTASASQVTASTATDSKYLVVVHDDWVNLSSQGLRYLELHAKSTFASVADSLGLEIRYHRTTPLDLYRNTQWRSGPVAGVVSMGVCKLGTTLMTLGQRAGLLTLNLDVKPCVRRQDDSSNLPIYKAKTYRRFQCVVHILYRWLRYGTPQGNTSSAYRPKMRVVGTRVSQLPRRPSYQQEYVNCVGPEVVASEESEVFGSGRASSILSGRHMNVATIHRPPFVVLEMSGEEDIVGAKGFCIEMLKEMAKRLNFTYTLVLPYDGNWGSPMENGTFNGMVGMVQRKTVDFAIASFTITYIRDTVIDFTHAFYEEPTTILIPPPSEENNFLAFLEPFSWKVWAVTLGSILVVGPLMWVLANVGNLPVLYPHDRRHVSHPPLRYVWDCAFSLTTQSGHMRHTEPARLLYGMWWALCVILIYTYTGTLIAFLTVPRMANLINSLEELANQKEVLWTYRAKTAHDVLFSNARPPSTYSKIGRLLKDRPELLVKSNQEGVEAVLKGRTAFIKEKSWLDFAMEEDYLITKKCRLAQVNQQFFSAGFGWVLQEDASYLQLFNIEILKMAQSGLFTIWKQQYWPRPNECTVSGANTASGPKPLQLKNFTGHFFLFAVGLGLALMTFLTEATHCLCQRASKDASGVKTRPRSTPTSSHTPKWYLNYEKSRKGRGRNLLPPPLLPTSQTTTCTTSGSSPWARAHLPSHDDPSPLTCAAEIRLSLE